MFTYMYMYMYTLQELALSGAQRNQMDHLAENIQMYMHAVNYGHLSEVHCTCTCTCTCIIHDMYMCIFMCTCTMYMHVHICTLTCTYIVFVHVTKSVLFLFHVNNTCMYLSIPCRTWVSCQVKWRLAHVHVYTMYVYMYMYSKIVIYMYMY